MFAAQDHATGVWRAEGAEGAALVAVPDEPSGFAAWLRDAGQGGAGPRSGTWVAAPVRGCDRASAWADTFAEVLGWHGIDCQVYATLDAGPNPP
jgi:hypothetical protein